MSFNCEHDSQNTIVIIARINEILIVAYLAGKIGVVFLEMLLARLAQFHCHQLVATLLESLDDLANESALKLYQHFFANRIRLTWTPSGLIAIKVRSLAISLKIFCINSEVLIRFCKYLEVTSKISFIGGTDVISALDRNSHHRNESL